MTTIGTSHFVNFTKACDYYKRQGHFVDNVSPAIVEMEIRGKIDDGEIYIGKPEVGVGQRLVLLDDGCRYGLED